MLAGVVWASEEAWVRRGVQACGSGMQTCIPASLLQEHRRGLDTTSIPGAAPDPSQGRATCF